MLFPVANDKGFWAFFICRFSLGRARFTVGLLHQLKLAASTSQQNMTELENLPTPSYVPLRPWAYVLCRRFQPHWKSIASDKQLSFASRNPVWWAGMGHFPQTLSAGGG